MSNIPKSQEDILADAFEQWKTHPISNSLIACINKHKQSFVEQISTNWQSLSESQLRAFCANLKNCDAIINLMTDFTVFKTKLNTK